MKRILAASLCAVLLLSAAAAAGAAGTEEAGFYNVGTAELVEITPLSESGEPVQAVLRDVDGNAGDEVFYPGSCALRVTLQAAESGKWYLLTVSAGDTVLYAEQQSGGGPVTFRAAFLLPRDRTDLTLRIGSDAESFPLIAVALSYTPGPTGGDSGCPRDDSCVMAAFSDLEPSAWYHDGVHYVLAAGLMQGYGDGIFSPDGTASRAMAAQILWSMEGRPDAESGDGFADVAGDAWYADAVRWASFAGVITGWTDDAGRRYFAPDADVTREQFAAMLYRYAKLHGEGFDGGQVLLLDFPDAGDAAEWAYEPLCWCVMKGVVNGMDGFLTPQGKATRAQVACMIARFVFGA